ncbi:hypothetical protein DITRI_Ditri13aG0095700 [Diplodiscus trichospermus]
MSAEQRLLATVSSSSRVNMETDLQTWIVKTDAAFNEISHLAKAGVVVLDPSGGILFSAWKMFSGVRDVLHAEVQAIHFALELALSRYLPKVAIHSDSLQAVNMLTRGKGSFLDRRCFTFRYYGYG